MLSFPIQELMDAQKCYDSLLKVLHPQGLKSPAGHPVHPGQKPHEEHLADEVVEADEMYQNAGAYNSLPNTGRTSVQVCYSFGQGEWVREVHTNSIEGF